MKRQIKPTIAMALIGMLLLSWAPMVSAQQEQTTAGGPQAKLELSGRVFDQKNAFLIGAQVTVTSATGDSKVLKTDNQGIFRFTNLEPGTYQINVYLDG